MKLIVLEIQDLKYYINIFNFNIQYLFYHKHLELTTKNFKVKKLKILKYSNNLVALQQYFNSTTVLW